MDNGGENMKKELKPKIQKMNSYCYGKNTFTVPLCGCFM